MTSTRPHRRRDVSTCHRVHDTRRLIPRSRLPAELQGWWCGFEPHRRLPISSDRLGLEPKVCTAVLFPYDCLHSVAMTCNLWPEYTGKVVCYDPGPACSCSCSDGQKRPVFIYRFLTAGAIDGTHTWPFVVLGGC